MRGGGFAGRLAFLALAALLLVPRAVAAQGCDVPAATVPVRDVLGFVVVRAAVGATPVSLLLDTGAESGLLLPEAARRLRLPLDPLRRSLLRGTGGEGALSRNARVPVLSLGGLTVGGLSLPVGDLPAVPHLDPPVAGLLGADLLAHFDVELDLGHGVMALRPAGACPDGPAWPGAYDVPLRRSGDWLLAGAAVDGQAVSALLDTGAQSLVLSDAAARRLGVADAALARDPGGITGGVDLRQVPFHWHRFAALRLGTETVEKPVLTVTELRGEAELLIGSAWFATHRVWLSWSPPRLVVQPR